MKNLSLLLVGAVFLAGMSGIIYFASQGKPARDQVSSQNRTSPFPEPGEQPGGRANNQPSSRLETPKASQEKTPLPAEMIGFWEFDKLSALSNSGQWVDRDLERVPTGLRVKKITKDGICYNPLFQVDGDEYGMKCKGGYLPLEVTGNQVKFPDGYVFVEAFSGYQYQGSNSARQPWPVPAQWSAEKDRLTFIALGKETKEPVYKYIFKRHPYIQQPATEITLTAEQTTIDAGKDLILRGKANTAETIRIYGHVNLKEYVDFMPFYQCDSKVCGSRPLIKKGTPVPTPPVMKGPTHPLIDFENPEYFDCPFTPNHWTLDAGELVTTKVVCVKPQANGEFEVALFNDGGPNSGQDRLPITITAKLANQPVSASLDAVFLTCRTTPGAVCKNEERLKR